MESPQVISKPQRYREIFAVTLLKTLAVGIGITVFVLVASGLTQVSEQNQCNVSVRTLYGELVTYPTGGDETDSASLTRALLRDKDDTNIKAIILDIDSPGGYPVAGEEVARALQDLGKPSVAVIRNIGASAAYWAATGATHILASRSSDVGSIGVIVSFPDESAKNEREGILYNEFSSGKFKNLGTPTRPVTAEEKILLEEGINEVFVHFVEVVARARNLDIAKVMKMADGRTMTGERAKEEGLIDEVGGFLEAKKYLETTLLDKPVLCEPNAEPLF